MEGLIFALLAWIGANSELDTDVVLPNVVFTTQHNMCALYGIDNKRACDSAKLKGFYDKNVTVYLRSDFDADDPSDQSRLLHELVHYVQWMNQSDQAYCLGQLELEAYALQDKWRAAYGLDPSISEFKRIMLAASCDD